MVVKERILLCLRSQYKRWFSWCVLNSNYSLKIMIKCTIHTIYNGSVCVCVCVSLRAYMRACVFVVRSGFFGNEQRMHTLEEDSCSNGCRCFLFTIYTEMPTNQLHADQMHLTTQSQMASFASNQSETNF